MNNINSYTGTSIFKLVIPFLIALACAPITALAATVLPNLDTSARFGAQKDSKPAFNSQVRAGRIAAGDHFTQFRVQAVHVRHGNDNIGAFRESRRSGSRFRDSLFARSIIAEQAITLETTTESLCGRTAANDCVTSFGGKNFADAQAAVPVPAALWLFASGLLGVIGIARRRSSTAA